MSNNLSLFSTLLARCSRVSAILRRQGPFFAVPWTSTSSCSRWHREWHTPYHRMCYRRGLLCFVMQCAAFLCGTGCGSL